MREETKKREYCKECGRISYHGELKVTCDYCKKDMTEQYYDPKLDTYTMRLFKKHSDGTDEFQFCSWNCFLSYVKNAKLQPFDFISLPYLKEDQLETLQNRIKEHQP